MPSPQATIRSSLVEQLSHRLFMRHCARPASRHPLLVSGQRCLYLGFFLRSVTAGEKLVARPPSAQADTRALAMLAADVAAIG